MGGCTEFCGSLRSIRMQHSTLLSHEALTEHLKFTEDDREQGRLLGVLEELIQRTTCRFCQLVVAAISDSLKPEKLDEQDLKTPIRVLLFPGEQSFRLSFPSRLGLRLTFLTNDVQQISGPDVSRPISIQGVKLDDIRKWLTTCNEQHSECTLENIEEAKAKFDGMQKMPYFGRFNESSTSNFRLIDLELGCVKRAALDERYVTLSYVWGNLPMFRLRMDNLEQLSMPGSLEHVLNDLPQTVRDAMDLVNALGERYIWIDGLCLVQDDADDVSLGIEMMNSIYHGSCFTIVAGTGTDANAGLPGFGGTPRHTDPAQVVANIAPDLKMTYMHSIDWHLAQSPYNQRGWTLQELVLPRRTLIFISGQVFFRCREANWSEALWSDSFQKWLDPDDSNIIRFPDPAAGFMPSFWAYSKLCEDYSRRLLRNDGDAVRAFAGITRPLAAGMETPLVDGMPGYYIDHFVLFALSDGRARRRPQFASFSWAGWEGSIMFPRENFVWFKKDGSRNIDPRNVLRHFRAKCLVRWESLNDGASIEWLTSFYDHKKPSRLLEFMRQYSHVFGDVEEDPEKSSDRGRWNSSSGSHCDVPRWLPWNKDDGNDEEFDPDDMEKHLQQKLQPRQQFSIKGFDLANGHAEFLRLISKIDDVYARLTLMNWLAVRNSRERTANEEATPVGPRPLYRSPERGNYEFREPYTAEKREERRKHIFKDRRAEIGKMSRARAAKRKGEVLDPETREIPLFPPYTLLAFSAISMHLLIGETPSTDTPFGGGRNSNPFDRIAGIPLLSASGETVGSLHPDNVEMLAKPGSAIELLVISHANTPMVKSALTSSGDKDEEQQWNLLWVLHIVWIDGIAERRGVGQVLESALEVAVEPKPQAKYILLG